MGFLFKSPAQREQEKQRELANQQAIMNYYQTLYAQQQQQAQQGQATVAAVQQQQATNTANAQAQAQAQVEAQNKAKAQADLQVAEELQKQKKGTRVAGGFFGSSAARGSFLSGIVSTARNTFLGGA